jgi:hypothetical protein
MATIAAIFRNEAPDDTSNRKRLIRDTLVEGLATMGKVWQCRIVCIAVPSS